MKLYSPEKENYKICTNNIIHFVTKPALEMVWKTTYL